MSCNVVNTLRYCVQAPTLQAVKIFPGSLHPSESHIHLVQITVQCAIASFLHADFALQPTQNSLYFCVSPIFFPHRVCGVKLSISSAKCIILMVLLTNFHTEKKKKAPLCRSFPGTSPKMQHQLGDALLQMRCKVTERTWLCADGSALVRSGKGLALCEFTFKSSCACPSQKKKFINPFS